MYRVRNDGRDKRSDVIIGDYHLMRFGIRDLMKAQEPVFKAAKAAPEVYASLGKYFKEQGLLEGENLFEAFSAVHSVSDTDAWREQVYTL